ncbi:MAG: hypothetical protein AB8F78_07675 [Saprospiraceae bacterium]
MSKAAARVRLINSGVLYTFGVAILSGVAALVAVTGLGEELLGIPFGFSVFPSFLLGAYVALRVRGVVGGKWMLSAFRKTSLAEHRDLMIDAQANHIIDLPDASTYPHFGPAKLEKFELERLYKDGLVQGVQSFKFSETPKEPSAIYERSNVVSTVVPASIQQLNKPSSSGTYYVSGRKLVLGMLRSLWGVVGFIFFWYFMSLSYLGWVFIAYGLYYLYSHHWKHFSNYNQKKKILQVGEKGVSILFPEGLVELAWRDVVNVTFRNVLMEDDSDDEWLLLSTASRGQVSLNLKMLDVGSPGEIEDKIASWRDWAHQERMRIAMGGGR